MPKGFNWRGRHWDVNGEELLNRAKSIVDQGAPQEAFRYKAWAVDINGQPVSVKWLFALATGARHSEFQSPSARRALAQIGIHSHRVGKRAPEADRPRGPTREEKRALRDGFLREIQTLLPDKLPARARHGELKIESNWLKVHYAEFGGMHYELRLARIYHEIAIHFESSREASLDRLSVFEPEVDRLASEVGHQVIAEPWGSYWARVAIILDKGPLTTDRATMYADLMARFVNASFSLLEQAYARRPAKGRKTKNRDTAGRDNANAHSVLDKKIAEIKEFLRGRSCRPSDEVLCDWVQFCYTFQLYAEAHQLFDLVDKSAVNNWLHWRTSRLASVCRLKPKQGH